MMRRIFGILILALVCAAPIAAQNEVELGRLATDQRQIAEQVRRLDKLLGVLEDRDRAEGREKEAELLAGARETLRGSADAPINLAGALESVALELSRKQTGSALESQAAAIQLLQELLEKLVKDQQRELERQHIADLQEWQKGLEELAGRQQELMDRAQELEESEASEGEADDAAREELARDQQELADAIEEFNDEQAREGNSSEDTEKAEEAAERAAEELQPPQSAEQEPSPSEEQSMDEAQKQQAEAKDALERQQEKVEEELDRREAERKKQILLDVKEEAQKLLQRHSALLDEYVGIHEENDGGRLSRGDRSRLRRVAQDERAIGEETGDLLLIIDEYGADSFPFFMGQLQEDHERLSTQIGPPRYRLNESAVQLGKGLKAGWTDLVDAIQTEEDRIREQLETPQGAPGQSPEQEEEEDELSPLVQFTAELQLLKRMQASMTDQLTALLQRLSAYERAGVEADPMDISELHLLQDRQQELALQFQSIVDRALGATEAGEGEEL